jgi:hypothetical protein
MIQHSVGAKNTNTCHLKISDYHQSKYESCNANTNFVNRGNLLDSLWCGTWHGELTQDLVGAMTVMNNSHLYWKMLELQLQK